MSKINKRKLTDIQRRLRLAEENDYNHIGPGTRTYTTEEWNKLMNERTIFDRRIDDGKINKRRVREKEKN